MFSLCVRTAFHNHYFGASVLQTPTMERSEKHKCPEGHCHTFSANRSSETSPALPVRVNISVLPTCSLLAVFKQQKHSLNAFKD